jgi:hypothetical protein
VAGHRDGMAAADRADGRATSVGSEGAHTRDAHFGIEVEPVAEIDSQAEQLSSPVALTQTGSTPSAGTRTYAAS